MAREYRILAAVGPVFPPAPRVVRLCEDLSVLGVVFFLMERRPGIILRKSVPAELDALPQFRARVSDAFIDCLIEFHSIDVSAEPLASLGRPDGFVERQVKGWSDRWYRARTAGVPDIDRVIHWLAANIPQSGPPTLVHNDFKLDNIVLRAENPIQVEALLDWEMTTIGDPLADLGLALTYWAHADVPGMARLTSEPGWATRDQLVHAYATHTGRDVSAVPYHEVLGVFKLAVILQQIYFRYANGQTTDERFRYFDRAVADLAARAAHLMDAAG
jgi:aminoglycoside phosphotransferase (APT) family kinase protein